MSTWGSTGGRFIVIDGVKLYAMDEGTPIMFMNLPIGPRVISHDFLQKARACFFARSQVLHSSASLKSRMNLLDRTVWASMSWVIGILRPTKDRLQVPSMLSRWIVLSAWQGGSADPRRRMLTSSTGSRDLVEFLRLGKSDGEQHP